MILKNMHRKSHPLLARTNSPLELDSILEFHRLMENPLTAAAPRKARDQALVFTLSAITFNPHNRHKIFECKEKNLEPYKAKHSQVIVKLSYLFLVAKYTFIISIEQMYGCNSVG